MYIATLLLGVLFISLHKIFHEELNTSPLLFTILHEVGMALIIAVVLIYTIDGISKKKHETIAQEFTEKLNKDIFHAIYKRYIPSVVFEEIERCVLGAHVIRENYCVSYTIQPLTNAPAGVPCNKYVSCLAQSNYTIRNLTDSTVKHSVCLFLERPIDKQLSSFVKINEFRINNELLTDDVIAKHTKANGSDEQISFQMDVNIPPKSSISVSSTAHLVKFSTDQEVWSSRIPSDGIDLTVTVPPGGFEVLAKANHSQPLKPMLFNSVTRRWSLNHGIFPHQSIAFWWHPLGMELNCPSLTKGDPVDKAPPVE